MADSISTPSSAQSEAYVHKLEKQLHNPPRELQLITDDLDRKLITKILYQLQTYQSPKLDLPVDIAIFPNYYNVMVSGYTDRLDMTDFCRKLQALDRKQIYPLITKIYMTFKPVVTFVVEVRKSAFALSKLSERAPKRLFLEISADDDEEPIARPKARF